MEECKCRRNATTKIHPPKPQLYACCQLNTLNNLQDSVEKMQRNLQSNARQLEQITANQDQDNQGVRSNMQNGGNQQTRPYQEEGI